MESDVGQYWFCVSSRRYLCSSRCFRSSSRRMWTILVLRFVSSLQIVESPNVGQYWFCVSPRRFRSLSRRIGSVPMRLGSSRRSRIRSRRSLLFAVSFFWVSTYRRFSFILLALFFIFSYAFLSLSFHISYGFTFRRVLSFVGSFHIIVSPSFTWDSGNIFPKHRSVCNNGMFFDQERKSGDDTAK